MTLSQSSIYSDEDALFCNVRQNLLYFFIAWLICVFESHRYVFIKLFLLSLLQSIHLNVSKLSLTVMYSRLDEQFLYLLLCISSARLLAKFEKASHKSYSINKLYFLLCGFPTFVFSIGIEAVILFSVFPSRHSNQSSYPSASCLIIKLYSYFDPFWKTIEISFGVLYLRLQMQWAAPLHLPVQWQWSQSL